MQDVATTTSVLATGRLPSVGTMPVDGRSPGSRVVATFRLPSLAASGISEGRSPHTVAGAAEAWGADWSTHSPFSFQSGRFALIGHRANL